jgi:hypothetical protein
MDSMDNFRERFEALERRTEQLMRHTRLPLIVTLWMAALLLVGVASAQAPVQVGEVLILSSSGGTPIPSSISPTPTFTGTPTPAGALFVLNLATMESRLLSDFGNAKQGEYLPNPTNVIVLDNPQGQGGTILVVDGRRGVYRVDPATGIRTPVHKPSGPGGKATPIGLAAVVTPPR